MLLHNKASHIVRCKVCLEDVWKASVTPLEGVPLSPQHFTGINGYPDPDPVFCACPNCQQVPFIVDQFGGMFLLTDEGQILPEYKGSEDGRFLLREGIQ